VLKKIGALFGLVLRNPALTMRLLTWRRLKNALDAIAGKRGNLGQILTRYQAIYQPRESGHAPQTLSVHAPLGDIVLFSVIDWDFRFQRPQHFATGLSQMGYRVFYICPTPLVAKPERQYVVLKSPSPMLHVVQLASGSFRLPDLHQCDLSESEAGGLATSLRALLRDAGTDSASALVEHPAWWSVARIMSWDRIVYDCLDHHAGFAGAAQERLQRLEHEMIAAADCSIASSKELLHSIEKSGPSGGRPVLVRNGCEYKRFASAPRRELDPNRPVLGYIGAISTWFDQRLLTEVAKMRPNWEFVLVGATTGADTDVMQGLQNIRFIGEVPYEAVPELVGQFDICLIPFVLSSLTKATNPVKLYEYLAAGRPVIGTRLPELAGLDELGVACVEDPAQFIAAVETLLPSAHREESVRARQAWASRHDWSERCKAIADVLQRTQRCPI